MNFVIYCVHAVNFAKSEEGREIVNEFISGRETKKRNRRETESKGEEAEDTRDKKYGYIRVLDHITKSKLIF